MLTIRLVRTGKKHQAYFRVVVADKRKAPGAKFVEILGNYDPHAKKLTVKKEKLEEYMKNGAQPSNTLAKVLKSEKFELPKWVKIAEKKKASKKKAKEEAEPKKEPKVVEESGSAEDPKTAEGETPEASKAEEVKAEEAPKEKSELSEKNNQNEPAASDESQGGEPAEEKAGEGE